MSAIYPIGPISILDAAGVECVNNEETAEVTFCLLRHKLTLPYDAIMKWGPAFILRELALWEQDLTKKEIRSQIENLFDKH